MQTEKTRETARAQARFLVPSVDIVETTDEYVLLADMPGVEKKGVELLLESNELTILGKRCPAPDKGTPKATVLHTESVAADYRRIFVLDPVIDTTRITAEIEQGVLTVRLPKAEKVKPRLIPVTD